MRGFFCAALLGLLVVASAPALAQAIPRALEGISLGMTPTEVEAALGRRSDVRTTDRSLTLAKDLWVMSVSLKGERPSSMTILFSEPGRGHKVSEIWAVYRRHGSAETALANAVRAYGKPMVIDRVLRDHRIVMTWGGRPFYEGDPTVRQPNPGTFVEPNRHQLRTLLVVIRWDPAKRGTVEETWKLTDVGK